MSEKTGLKIKVVVYEVNCVTEDRDVGGMVFASDEERREYFEKEIMDAWASNTDLFTYEKDKGLFPTSMASEKYIDAVDELMQQWAEAKILLEKPWSELGFIDKREIWENCAGDDRNWQWNEHTLLYDIADIETVP